MVCGNAGVMSVKIALRGRKGGCVRRKKGKGSETWSTGGRGVSLSPRSLGKKRDRSWRNIRDLYGTYSSRGHRPRGRRDCFLVGGGLVSRRH